MNLRAASLVFVAVWSFSVLPASACRFCNAGPEMDRYTTTDPMNAVPFDALVDQYSDKTRPVPKPEEIVTSKAALAQAAATATPQPGAELAPVTPNSYRSRLLRDGAPAKSAAAAPATDGSKVNALGEWTSRAVDVALLGTLVGVGLFFGRGARRQTA
jgi:hypothetical protein